MRKLTKEEQELWVKANRLRVGRKEGTNLTPLYYILEGRAEELKRMIKEVEEA